MEPICKPVVNTQLDRMNGLQRVVECFLYTIVCIEHWLSLDGNIREWLRKNLRWSVLMVIPTVTAFPIVTLALWELESSVNVLTAIASKLVFLPVLALLALISITIVCRIFSAFKR